MADKLSARKKLLFALVIFFLQLLVIEGVLRILKGEYYAENQFFPHNRDISFISIYDKDPNLFWRLKKNITAESSEFSALAYHINNWGFRGPDIEAPAEQSVIALGNSCSFGWGVRYQDIFTARLQQALQNTRVINLGTPGYSSFQGKRLLDELESRPQVSQAKVALIMFGWNDHWPAAQDIDDKSQKMAPGWALSLQNSLSRLRIFQLVRKLTLEATAENKLTRPRIDRVAGKHRVSLSDFKMNLTEMIERCRESGTMPILLVPPIASLQNYFPDVQTSAFHDLHTAYQGVIREVASESNTVLIDLQPPFDLRDDLFDFPSEDPVHFNAEGHRVVAEEILKSLQSPSIISLLK